MGMGKTPEQQKVHAGGSNHSTRQSKAWRPTDGEVGDEKVKELLIYGELTLNEISYQLGYSSVAHLSAQFKKVTGFTPSAFKKNGGTRKSLDQL